MSNMNFHVISIFPQMLDSYINESILGRAIKNKIINISAYELRKYSKDKHKNLDGRPFGGGPGMVMMVDPIVNAVEDVKNKIAKKYEKDTLKYQKDKIKLKKSRKPLKPKILFVLFSPGGVKFTTDIAKEVKNNYTDIVMICGRYEGIDARIKEIYDAVEWSIGDYVLTGGEIPAMIVIDCISRQLEGVLGKIESLEENRISSHQVYGRPEVYEYKTKTNTGKAKVKKYLVPKVLLSGNHAEINKWKQGEK
jgi:tRNA (guanine37-N1)-methyltransferase